MLPVPGMLEEIELQSYGAEEMEYVCQCLQKNTSVTQLNASMNLIGDVGAKHVASMLSQSPKLPLARLSLNGCGIGAEGGKALAEALASHSDLMIVELMNNNLGEEGGQALLKALERNKRLKEVKVAWATSSEGLHDAVELYVKSDFDPLTSSIRKDASIDWTGLERRTYSVRLLYREVEMKSSPVQAPEVPRAPVVEGGNPACWPGTH
eukprot:symbB.v1.2.016134.t2/scaffold1221.1/size130907/10